jgi:HKD family nuclease
MEFVHQPATSNRLGEFLLENLRGNWDTFRAAIAFVKRSGTKHIVDALTTFSQRKTSEFVVGINHRGTSKEGLDDLLRGVGKTGRVIIFNNPLGFTFHPKVYLFKSEKAADILIGSGNMTEGGIYGNYEASVRVRLDLSKKDDAAFLKKIEDVLDDWADISKGTGLVLDEELLTKLVARGDVPIESLSAEEGDEPPRTVDDDEADEDEAVDAEPAEMLFTGRAVPRAPSVAKPTVAAPKTAPATKVTELTAAATSPTGNRGFVMVLQQTDVGKGQTTRGTARRSPEIFIPLRARDADPVFWGWPNQFVETSTKYDRAGVRMRLGTQVIVVNIMGWKLKKDLRLRHEALRSGGKIGDILRMEKAPSGSGFEYLVDFVPKGTTMHPVYLARCTQPVPNSKKTFGYY